MKKIFLLALCCGACSTNIALHAFDLWSIGIFIVRPFWDIFAKKISDKDLKTEEDRVNESIDRSLAIIHSTNISPEQKTAAHMQLERDQKEKQCISMKRYLKNIEETPENKELIEKTVKNIQECSKEVLQMAQK